MENLKSTKTGTKKIDLKESLLPSTNYLDPRREPCKWLGGVLIDLLEQDTEESKEALKWALPRMAQWLEPGIIDQLFVPWINHYMELLAEDGNNHNNENQKSPSKDQKELKE
tara:strand:+ start:348 stop:683 length:336 start_codon:yes stop_codon:yes gene_type:complete